jgi:Zn-dependent peptidase ImmA (M78 family)
MIVEFEGKFAKTKEDMICNAIAYGASKLFPDNDDVYINISAITKEGLYGDCMYEDDDEFTIRLNKKLSIQELVRTVLHELVHVNQFLNCLIMDLDSPYEERWQEIEAHAMEEELVKGFNEWNLTTNTV